MIIRPFLPESPAWHEKKAKGTLRRPSIHAIFTPEFRTTSIITAIMFACSYGAAFGAIQQLPRIVPGLREIADLKPAEQQIFVRDVQLWQEIGGLVGRVALAFLAIRVASRRTLLRVFQVPGLILVPLVFYTATSTDINTLKWGVFFAGLVTVAQFSFWGNYLPLVYPLHLRGTGESFAANVGGRMLGTSFAAVTAQLAISMPGAGPSAKLAHAAAAVALLVYALGFICSFRLPEPEQGKLMD
jgi:hypothetical protein